jgi:hypothetical protein
MLDFHDANSENILNNSGKDSFYIFSGDIHEGIYI